MKINAIYVKSTKEILYSRSTYDYRPSSDNSCAVDGGFEYFRYNFKDRDNIITIKLDGDVLLKQILHYDWNYRNKNCEDFPDGFCGRFVIQRASNPDFYKKLIIEGFDEVWSDKNVEEM